MGPGAGALAAFGLGLHTAAGVIGREDGARLGLAPFEFGIVPLEAMASGLVVVGPDAGGPRESVVHGSTGWLVRAGDAEAYAKQLSVVAGMSASELGPMRRAARARAAEFSWDAFTAQLDDVVEGVVRA